MAPPPLSGDADLSAALAPPSRFNYASERNGAKVLAANREAKHASAVLSADVDSYMISPCAADKWLVVELSQEVRP